MLVELDNFDPEKVKEMLKNPNLAVERKAYLERYLEIDMLCRINLERGKINVSSVLKKMVDQEFDRKHHESTLAAHYLRLQDLVSFKHKVNLSQFLVSDKQTEIDLKNIRPAMNARKNRISDHLNPEAGENYKF